MKSSQNDPESTRPQEHLLRIDVVLKDILLATNALEGIAYFKSLVKHLAESLNIQMVYVTQKASCNTPGLKVIAGWEGGAPVAAFDYDPSGSYCADVLEESFFCAPNPFPKGRLKGLAARLPEARSYMGIVLADGNKVLGHLCFLDRRVVKHPAVFENVLRVVALRASLELRRMFRDRALAEKERRVDTLMNHLPGMAYRCKNDRKWTMEQLSDGCVNLTGYQPRDLILNRSLAFADLIHPEDLERVWLLVQAALRDHASFKLEYRIQTKTKAEKWVWEQGGGVYSDSGEVLAIEGFIHEITELKKAKLLLATILDNVLEGVITIDDRGTILTFNKSAERLFEYTAEEVLGRNVSLLMPPAEREQHDQYIANFRKTQKPKIIGIGREVVGLKKSGAQFPFFLNVGVEIMSDQKQFFVGTVRDLSRERGLEEQLRRAQKMESIGTLAGGIAHDFNNILAGIRGYVELMLEDADSSSELQEDLTEMLKACERGKDLILQILTFSRQEKPKREPMVLHPILKESLKLLRATIPSNIEFREDIDEHCPAMVGDLTQLHQIMLNLGTNAYQAMMERGGVLSVSLKSVEVGEKYNILPPNLTPGTYLRLSVGDTGIGMDEDTCSRIFDPFFTTKELGQGTGMGLSVVHGIVSNHDGAITVDSKPGEGSVFHLYFPVLGPSAEPLAVGEKGAPTGKEHLLLVDDDTLLLKVQARILGRQGYIVSPYSKSVDALAAFGDQPAKYDLVLTDQAMPQMTGLQLAGEIRKIRPNFPIILTTGFNDLMNREQAEIMGINAFLMKPLSKETLSKVVRDVLDHGSAQAD